MCGLIFSTTFVRNISHSKKTPARYDHKCTLVCMYSILYYCYIVMKLQFYRQIFQKFSNSIFNQNPSIGSRLVQCEQTYAVTNCHFSQFCKRAEN